MISRPCILCFVFMMVGFMSIASQSAVGLIETIHYHCRRHHCCRHRHHYRHQCSWDTVNKGALRHPLLSLAALLKLINNSLVVTNQ